MSEPIPPIIGEGHYEEAVVPLDGRVFELLSEEKLAARVIRLRDELAQMQKRGDDREHNMAMFIRDVREDICSLLVPLHDALIALQFPTPGSNAIVPLKDLDSKLGDLILKMNR